ncbi:nuclear transport factor 2 family protein [Kitasatospora sp. NBC_01266]|uniref:nuclear transport factor 2 family protein n=1 Tax=Kitasatospora sp. NBC_01266 TaxID=2903572 RepID=UPI002E33F625|nr:nuclear transport factor 2 family protein [Kitasatospora sp. NBC_01266]
MTQGAQEQRSAALCDRLDIIELCGRFGRLFDQRDWAALVHIFAEQVVIGPPDEPRSLTREELVEDCAAQVATVRSTEHRLTEHLVLVNRPAGTASCTAQYQVRHTGAGTGPEGRSENAGHYRFDLRATPSGWRITRLVATPTWRSGDPAILGAPPAADTRPADTRPTDADPTGADPISADPASGDAQSVARRFLEAIGDRDLPTAFGCLAEDVVLELPFAPPGGPLRLDGADAVRRRYTGVVRAARSIELPVVRAAAFADPEWVLVEYTGKLVQPNGGDYTNHYYGMFRVVDGKIKMLRELYDTHRHATQLSAEDHRAVFEVAGTA